MKRRHRLANRCSPGPNWKGGLVRAKTLSPIIEMLGLVSVVGGVVMLAGVAWALVVGGILGVAYGWALDK